MSVMGKKIGEKLSLFSWKTQSDSVDIYDCTENKYYFPRLSLENTKLFLFDYRKWKFSSTQCPCMRIHNRQSERMRK